MNGWVLGAAGVMVAIGTAFAFVRAEKGPTMLDRVVAMDVITAAVIAVVAVTSAVTDRWDLIPVLVALTLVAFVGSVTVARFVARDRDDDRRILTREQERERDAAREAFEAAAEAEAAEAEALALEAAEAEALEAEAEAPSASDVPRSATSGPEPAVVTDLPDADVPVTDARGAAPSSATDLPGGER